MYQPKPLDLSNVVLDKDLLSLVEEIAENVHDVWAKNRIEEGWTLGPIKDSIKKTTPLLVPYNELSEEEKQYDRNTALSTIKFLVKKGYQIKKRLI